MQRTKGWRKPDGVVYVGRPTRWGNPYSVETFGRAEAIGMFRALFDLHRQGKPTEFPVPGIEELRGKDLACWCPLADADGNRVLCHADVLLELANK
jgi:hypothetical protein